MISVSSFYKVERDPHYLIGKEEEKKQTAIRMKEHGLEKEFISLMTEMPVEEIEKL